MKVSWKTKRVIPERSSVEIEFTGGEHSSVLTFDLTEFADENGIIIVADARESFDRHAAGFARAWGPTVPLDIFQIKELAGMKGEVLGPRPKMPRVEQELSA